MLILNLNTPKSFPPSSRYSCFSPTESNLQKATALGAERITHKLAISSLVIIENNPEYAETRAADEHSAAKPIAETKGDILALAHQTLPCLPRVRILLKIFLASVFF